MLPASNTPPPATPPPPERFEEALGRLEEIVRELEDGTTGLDASLLRYEEGVRLLRHCQGLLERAERRIELLAGVDAAGQPRVAPFDDSATHSVGEEGTAAAKKRSRRRATAQPEEDDAAGPAAPNVDSAGKLF